MMFYIQNNNQYDDTQRRKPDTPPRTSRTSWNSSTHIQSSIANSGSQRVNSNYAKYLKYKNKYLNLKNEIMHNELN